MCDHAVQSFDELFTKKAMSSKLRHNLRVSGFQGPTAIQRQAVPALIAGREVLAAAPTGVLDHLLSDVMLAVECSLA